MIHLIFKLENVFQVLYKYHVNSKYQNIKKNQSAILQQRLNTIIKCTIGLYIQLVLKWIIRF